MEWSDYFLLSTLCLSNMLWGFQITIFGPLFPPEASSKGLTASTYGLPSSIFGIFFMITLPYSTYILKYGDVKLVYITCSALTSLGMGSLGLFHFIQDGSAFLVASTFVRGILGITSAFTECCINVVTVTHFTHQKAFCLALVYAFFAIGMSAGPLLTGLIYDYTDFSFPFIFVGGFTALVTFMLVFAVPRSNNTSSRENLIQKTNSSSSINLTGRLFSCIDVKTLFNVLCLRNMWIGVTSNVFHGYCLGYIHLILEPYIRVLNYSQFQVSIFFALPSAINALIKPVIGKLIDIGIKTLTFIILGLIFQALCLVFLGPVPSNGPKLWNLLLLGVFSGVSQAALAIPNLIYILEIMKNNDFPDSESTVTIGVNLWLCAYSVGGIFGNSISGVLYDNLGLTSTSLLNVAICLKIILMLCYSILRAKCRNKAN